MYILSELQCFKGNTLHAVIVDNKGGDPVRQSGWGRAF